ncbi:hypothetical protein AB0H43_13295 [Hamadaea sp. NPDC050747]|uniref:hypothetical protein n=1 Tax=Hamadaea sp. NPDC050747 TaxID=3155789 RepID=UPI0033EBF66D
MTRTDRRRALSPDDVAALLHATVDAEQPAPTPPSPEQIMAIPVARARRRDRLPRPVPMARLLTDRVRNRVTAVVSAAAGLVALATAAVVTTTANTVATPPTASPVATTASPAPTARARMADTPAPQLVSVSQDGTALLHVISQRVRDRAAPPILPVTYVRVRDYWADVSDADPTQARSQTAYDLRVWWAPDRSAHTRRVTLPTPVAGVFDEPYLREPIPAGQPVRDYRDRPGSGAGNDEGIRLQIPHPADTPGQLAAQLAAAHPGTTGTKATLRAVADLYRQHHLSPRQRAAVLSILADSGLRYMGDVHDRAGRPGIAFGVDLDNDGPSATRFLMVIDEETGTLLSYEEDLLAPATTEGATRTAVATAHYVLYLESTTMSRIP